MTKTIMVVDDQESTLILVKAVLEANKFKAVVFSEPRKALDWLKKGKMPDILLLDMQMPDMNGIQFCGELKKEKKLAQLKVALFTASNELEDSLLKKCNAVCFISKPFENNKFIKQIKKCLK